MAVVGISPMQEATRASRRVSMDLDRKPHHGTAKSQARDRGEVLGYLHRHQIGAALWKLGTGLELDLLGTRS